MTVVSAAMLFMVVSPEIVTLHHNKYEPVVLYHSRVAVQLRIPVVTDVFGVYQFIGPGAFTFGFGYRRPVLSNEKIGRGWWNKVCGPSHSLFLHVHGACNAF